MEFIDLKTQQSIIKNSLNLRLEKVLNHNKYILGPEVFELEERLAEYVGVKHCVSVSSGTDALLLAMIAEGINRGDEVITPAFSFIAPAEMIAFLGAKPVFVDVDPLTFNLDPSHLESVITSKTKAILVVNLFGQCADFDRINQIADKYGLKVIEDAAQSFGATYKGKKSCGLATLGCTSFFPSKPLGCYGDGGACFTNSSRTAEILKQLRFHGESKRYNHVRVGFNSRLDTIQAAVLLSKLELLDNEIIKRNKVAKRYDEIIDEIIKSNFESITFPDNNFKIIKPYISNFNTSVYAQYTIKVFDKNILLSNLQSKQIPTAIHYPKPIYTQPVFNYDKTILHNSERLGGFVLSLPMHPYLSLDDQNSIAEVLKESV